MIYNVTHRTTYLYTDMISTSHNQVCLQPRDTAEQTCLEYQLAVDPEPDAVSERRDYFGNHVAFFNLNGPHRSMSATARCQIELHPTERPDLADGPAWESARDRVVRERTADSLAAYQFAFDSPLIRAHSALADYAAISFTPSRPLWQALMDLTQRIHREFKYEPNATTVTSSVDEFFSQRRGVCQDFAHLQIACLRSIGLPARYVSGYLRTEASPGQAGLVGADASHAWVSVYSPGERWLDVDPTNNTVPVDTHITVAWGRDYSDVSPVKGVVLGGGDHSIEVSVEVAPVSSGGFGSV